MQSCPPPRLQKIWSDKNCRRSFSAAGLELQEAAAGRTRTLTLGEERAGDLRALTLPGSAGGSRESDSPHYSPGSCSGGSGESEPALSKAGRGQTLPWFALPRPLSSLWPLTPPKASLASGRCSPPLVHSAPASIGPITGSVSLKPSRAEAPEIVSESMCEGEWEAGLCCHLT